MKKLRTILVLLFALMMSLCLFACGGDDEEQGENPGENPGGEQQQDVGYKVEVYLNETLSEEHTKTLTGKVGTEVTITPDTISGYDFDGSHEGTVTKKTLSANEAENVFKLYYKTSGPEVDPDGPGSDLEDLDVFELYANQDDLDDGISLLTLELTDSDDEEDYKTKMQDVVFYAMDWNGEEDYFNFDDVNAVGTVTYHTVGEYTLTFTLKGNNTRSCSLSVVIDHDWGEEQNGVRTCQHDGASLQKRTENVIVHYGPFHSGIDVDLPAGAFTETEAYTNNNAANSAIKRFGTVNGVGGYVEVPTLTAGQLEPGMKITIRGTSMTTAGAAGPGSHANEYWNSTTIGIADRYNNESNSAHPGYVGGTSVLVREEGWVLYDGIGKGSTNRLAGIMGGAYATSGDWQNFGSHPNESTKRTPHTGSSGYVPGAVPTDWSAVEDWWVYSDGTGLNSGDYYGSETPIEYSWYYREDGVIELTYVYNYLENPTTLKAYVKVPASSVGFYDTVIHGDYNDLKITESEIISLRTPKQFRYNGLKDGAQTVYAENTAFDATTLNVEVEYAQNEGAYEPLLLANNQIYAYKGSLDLAALKANEEELNSTDAEKWISLAETNLSNKYTIYKIHVNKGGQQFVQLLNGDNGVLPFEVVDNRIDSVVGSDATIQDVAFKNNDKIGVFTFSLDANKKVALKLETAGYVQKLSETQSALFTNLNGATRYVSLRFNGATIETVAQFSETLTVKAGSADVPHIQAIVGNDLYLVLALKEAAADVVITGLQSTEVHLDLSTLKGFKVDSEVTENNLSLNGGTVSLKYHVDANTAADQIRFMFGPSPFTAAQLTNVSGRLGDTGMELTSGIYLMAFSHNVAAGELTITLKYGAVDLENYTPISIPLYVNGSETPDLVDVIDYNAKFDSGVDGYASLGNEYYATVSEAGKLEVLAARVVSDLKDNCVSETFTLNLNNGNYDSLKTNGLISVTYTVVEGEVRLTSAPIYVTATLGYIGTWADSRDTDKGLYITFTIDVVAMGITEGDYYFDSVDGFNALAHPETVYKVDQSAATPVLSTVTLDGTYTYELVSTAEGSCYVEGIYAWAVKSGDTVLCYAGVATAGGDHVDEDGDDKCDLCGGSMSENTSLASGAWFPTGHPSIDIQEGDVITFTGTYRDDIGEDGFGSVLAVMIEEAKTSGWDNTGVDEGTNGTWHTTQDGYAYWTNFSWEAATRIPYAEGVEGFGEGQGYERFTSSVITEEHQYNTANGVVNGYGTTIDETNFNAAKQGGTFRFIVTRANGVVTTTAQLWAPSMVAFHSVPYFEYTTTVQVDPDASRYTVKIFGKQQENNQVKLVDDKIYVTQSKLVNSLFDEVKSETVEGHTAPTTIEYEVTKDTSNVVVSLTGTAAHENSGYYAAFSITFDKALDSTTTVKLVDGEGNAIDGAVCSLNEDKTSLTVYLPIADGLKEAYLDFTNYKAITLQSDVKIDLSKLIVSNVTSVVAGTEGLTIGEGTFTVTYTGDVQGTDTLYIGDVSKTLAELSSEVDFNNGYSASVALTAGSQAVVTVKKHAANLNEVVSGVEIRLEKAGSLIARDVIAPALTVSGGTKVGNTDVYAVTDGATLVLLANAAFDLTLNVNAGEHSEGVVGYYNVSVNANGKSFKESNLLTKSSSIVYSENGDSKLIVAKLDLTDLHIDGETAYGYQVQGDSEHYYLVNAEGTITQTDVADGNKTTIAEGSCTEDKVEGVLTSDNSFYYNVETTAGNGHQWTKKEGASADDLKGYDEVYECSNECGTMKYVQTSTTQKWGGGTAGHYDIWGNGDATNWETFGLVHQGGIYEITGTNLSNETNVWDLPEPGITDSKGTNAQGFRIDNYVQNDNTALGVTATYAFKDAKNESFNYSFDNITAAVKTHLDGATVTYTFDYTDADKLVITMHLVNGEELDFTITVTVTGSNMLDSYYLAFHADGNLYTASKAETVVPAGKEPAEPLTKHVHDFNNDNDRCVEDDVLNPNHGNTDAGGKAHKYDATYHCEICGNLDPSHTTHTYNKAADKVAEGNIYCVCGALNPEHEHVYEDGQCKLCKAVGTANLTEAGFTASTYTSGALSGDNFNLSQPAHGDAEIEVGETLILVGTVSAPNIDENFDTVSWEIEEGWTQRADNWGWQYDTGSFTSTMVELSVYNKVAEASAIDWTVMQAIAKDGAWRIEIKFVSATEIQATVSITATSGEYAGYTYVNTVKLVSANDLTTLHAHIGMRDGTINLLGYKVVTAE